MEHNDVILHQSYSLAYLFLALTDLIQELSCHCFVVELAFSLSTAALFCLFPLSLPHTQEVAGDDRAY